MRSRQLPRLTRHEIERAMHASKCLDDAYDVLQANSSAPIRALATMLTPAGLLLQALIAKAHAALQGAAEPAPEQSPVPDQPEPAAPAVAGDDEPWFPPNQKGSS